MKVVRKNRSRLSYRIFLSVASVLTPLILLGAYATYSLISSFLISHLETDLTRISKEAKNIISVAADMAIRNYLHSAAKQNVNIIRALYDRGIQQGIPMEVVKQEAQDILLAQHIGESGYIYVLDTSGKLLVHPHRELLGSDVSEYSFIRDQIAKKAGYLEYQWKNPGQSEEKQKVLYMDYFAPWDWIVSVSAYRDELTDLLHPADIRDELLSIAADSEEQLFILSRDGSILVHPLFTGNVDEVSAEDKALMKEIVQQVEGKITYTVNSNGKRQKRVALFTNIDEYGWIVVSTAPMDSYHAPLVTLRLVLIVLLALALLVSMIVSLYLGNSITAPLRRLLSSLAESSGSVVHPSENLPQMDEIEELSAYISEYAQTLQNYNRKLESLLAEQRQTAFDLSIFKEVFEHVVEGILITDRNGIIIQANPAFETITGYSPEEAVGQNPSILKSGRHTTDFYQEMWNSLEEKGFWAGEIWNKRKNGEIYPEWLAISAIRNEQGEVSHYASVFNDISTLIEQQERIQFLAYHDYLTRLPNRVLLSDRMNQIFSACKRNGDLAICMILDLDNFKTVNDSMGPQAGDQLLIEFANRIEPVVRQEDTFCRLGSDEFAYLFRNAESGVEHIYPVIERFREALVEPFILQDQKIFLTISVGLAVYPVDADDGENLLKRANLALFHAQENGGNGYEFFSEEMEAEVKKRLHYLAKIRAGLELREFLPFLQPRINLETGEVAGMEALARWMSGGTLVSPGDFIPISEQSGLIIPLAVQIYEMAFAQTRKLLDRGHDLKLSVNLAPTQLKKEGFLEQLLQLQQHSGVPADRIEFEVTESTIMDNVGNSMLMLRKLAELGFDIAIDDFGTGYSSLEYLKQLPLTTLKIDRSFISGIGESRDDEILIRTIILMAKQFGLKIVAEGIEESHQVAFLRSHGCHEGQGFYYAKPMDGELFASWLEENQGRVESP